MWRLRAEAGDESAKTVERRAAVLSAILLVGLCLYIVASSVVGLIRHIEPDQSLVGIAVAAAAVIVMPLLGRWQICGDSAK